ncbi:N-acetylmuramoyl-L-alanine amidase [bacterium]|nr:N-acetylmuramoyl-L-alanine amidase [bacterium]
MGFDGQNIIVHIRPRPGEGLFRFASWTLRDWGNNYKNIKKYNQDKPLQKGQYVQFPFSALNDNMQSIVLQTLFPNDSSEEEVWAHRVVYHGETISLIAGVFAKNEISYQKLAKYNNLKDNGKNLQIGDVVNIPWSWVRKELNLKPVEVKEPLVVKLDQFGEPHAYYKMNKGESLYSSVVIRFTGRTLAEDVNDMAAKLLKLNNIEDEHFIHVGSEIKIPLEWISEDYLVKKAPTPSEVEPEEKLEIEPSKKEYPIHIIIDSGHGGKDPGALFGSIKTGDLIFEDETVYDISLRLSDLLKSKDYRVHLILEDPNQDKPVTELSMIKDSDERVMVHPPFVINHVNIGINMRIFLINHIYEQLIRKKVPRNNIVLISLHGDALHESLQGATVYYPDARLRSSNFRKLHSIYRKRKEYRKDIEFPVRDNSRAALLSADYGKTVIESFQKAGLKTHKSFAVRGYYYRKGTRTLPGILRYSKIPTSILIEVGNLNNRSDREGLRKAAYRQKVAAAILDSITTRFNQG